MKELNILLTCGLLALTITSCGSENIEVNNEQNVYESSVTSDYFVEVENYGRVVTVEEKPTKVLTLGPNCTELFVALGLEDYVIGRSLVNHSRGPLPEYAESVEAITYINYAEATREAILTSGADFIYAIDWEISEVGCNIEEVQDYGMNVYVNSATTVEELYKEIEDLGKIFDMEDVAKEFVDEQKNRIDTVGEVLVNTTPVNVLVYDSGVDGIFTSSGSNFESRIIELAGGRNIFDDLTEKQWVTVSFEEVLKRDPDVILIHDYDTSTVEEKIKEIKANPVLSELECVKKDRFATIELESVLPGNRVAYAVENLAKNFHQDLFEK